MSLTGFSALTGLSGIVGASGGGASPSVYTLTLDDLLTRFVEYTEAPASIRFSLAAHIGDPTGDIYLDDSNGSGNAVGTLRSHTALAAVIEDEITAISGTFAGKVAVVGASSEAGDRYDFTITFDASLGAVTLDFDDSQWYPTITLVETVGTEGVDDSPGSSASVEITANGADDTTSDSEGNSVTLDSNGDYASHAAGSGWSAVGGGSNPMTFSRNTVGVWDNSGYGVSSGAGSANTVSVGEDLIPGEPETHLITAEPVIPSGGTWKPGADGTAVAWNASGVTVAAQAIAAGWESAACEEGLDIGVVSIENGVNGNVGNLGPVNVNLTAPEITHSITPA